MGVPPSRLTARKGALALLALAVTLVASVGLVGCSVDAAFASNAPATYADGLGTGIFGPDRVYTSRQLCCVFIAFASYVPRLPTSGIPVGSISGLPQDNMLSFGGANGFTLNGNIGIYNWAGAAELPFTITATDGYSTVTKQVTLVFTDKGHYAYGGNFVGDSARDMDGAVPQGLTVGSSSYTLSMSTNYWEVRDGRWAVTAAAKPLTQHYGRTDVTATLHGSEAEGEVKQFPLWIVYEPEPIIHMTWTQTLSTALPVGFLVGQLRYWSLVGIYRLLTTDADVYFAFSASGAITVNKALVVGARQTWNLEVMSNTGKTVVMPIQFDVQQGHFFPSSVMSFTPGIINDHKRGQSVGQATVSGFTPTLWKIANRNSIGPYNLFAIDEKTGFVKCPDNAKLPGRTHKVTISATDGTNYVEATFDVPVTKSIGPIWHVGRNMSNVYPWKTSPWENGRGFETLEEVFWGVRGGRPDLDDWAAGYTIMLHPDKDPNYFANDNGIRTQEYGLRYGWLGPGTIRTFDLNGPRARVGGTVGRTGEGADMGGKGFFNLGDGDITLLNLEISWCTGSGSMAPGDDLSHGISCVRKNADVWGDLTMEGCFVHDADNGMESGYGPYDVYLRNNVFGNCGCQYVSSGATHANYVGGHGYIEITNNLYYQTMNGHNIKTRAYTGLIKNNRIYDGERGGASAQIDISNGGQYVVEGNDIHKGPNAQSYAAVNFAPEGTGDGGRPHSLTLRNNRIAVLTPDGNHFGNCVAVSIPRLNPYQWPLGEFLIEDNAFYMQPETVGREIFQHDGGDGGNNPRPIVIQRGNTNLKEPFQLNFKDTGTANPKATRLGWIPRSFDGNGDNFHNFGWGFQIETGTDDMRVWSGAPVGTVVGRCQAGGSAYWQRAADEKWRSYQFAFDGGASWRIVPDMLNFYGSAPIKVAPPSRFLLNAETGVLTTGTLVNRTLDYPRSEFVVVEAKVKDPKHDAYGQFAWFRFYVTTSEEIDAEPSDPGNGLPSSGGGGPGVGGPANSGGSSGGSSSLMNNKSAVAGLAIGIVIGICVLVALVLVGFRARSNSQQTALDRIRTEMQQNVPNVLTLPAASAAYEPQIEIRNSLPPLPTSTRPASLPPVPPVPPVPSSALTPPPRSPPMIPPRPNSPPQPQAWAQV